MFFLVVFVVITAPCWYLSQLVVLPFLSFSPIMSYSFAGPSLVCGSMNLAEKFIFATSAGVETSGGSCWVVSFRVAAHFTFFFPNFLPISYTSWRCASAFGTEHCTYSGAIAYSSSNLESCMPRHFAKRGKWGTWLSPIAKLISSLISILYLAHPSISTLRY